MKRSLYAELKDTYHGLLSESVRSRVYRALPAPVRRLRRRVIGRLQAGAVHDEIYDVNYYANLVEPAMERSAGAIASTICAHWGPRSVFDVGCGTGRLLVEFRERGVQGIGLELSNAALEVCRSRGLSVEKFDIESDDPRPGWRADVAISTEVGEHLPPACADRLVDVIAGLSDRVVFTASLPGGGEDHVNEQPRVYWIDKFVDRGFLHLDDVTESWQRAWPEDGVEGCFVEGLMVFERRS